ncbi:MAG: hypothetical protein ACJAY7_000833 [Pseudohongiellaceae bacterium]
MSFFVFWPDLFSTTPDVLLFAALIWRLDPLQLFTPVISTAQYGALNDYDYQSMTNKVNFAPFSETVIETGDLHEII